MYLISLGLETPDPFDKFADSWWRAVEKMNPIPDEIVICATVGNSCKILEIPLFAKTRTIVVHLDVKEPVSAYLNNAVYHCNGKWISWVGIDDLPLENLFTSVPTAEKKKKEIILSGIKTTSGQVIYSKWEKLVQSNSNTVMSNTVCTKELWVKAGGYPNVYFNDWGFWLRCYSLNPKIHKTKLVTMLFNDSEDYVRRSGLKNFDKFEAGFLEIKKIKSELNLNVNFKMKITLSIDKLVTKIVKVAKRFLN